MTPGRSAPITKRKTDPDQEVMTPGRRAPITKRKLMPKRVQDLPKRSLT